MTSLQDIELFVYCWAVQAPSTKYFKATNFNLTQIIKFETILSYIRNKLFNIFTSMKAI